MNKANSAQRSVIVIGACVFIGSCLMPPVYTRFLGFPLEFLGMKWTFLWDLTSYNSINLPMLILEWAMIAGATVGLYFVVADEGGSDRTASGRPRPYGSRRPSTNPYQPPNGSSSPDDEWADDFFDRDN